MFLQRLSNACAELGLVSDPADRAPLEVVGELSIGKDSLVGCRRLVGGARPTDYGPGMRPRFAVCAWRLPSEARARRALRDWLRSGFPEGPGVDYELGSTVTGVHSPPALAAVAGRTLILASGRCENGQSMNEQLAHVFESSVDEGYPGCVAEGLTIGCGGPLAPTVHEGVRLH